jgi:hypothetical protein
MSTVTIPRPDVTTEDVAAALRKGSDLATR